MWLTRIDALNDATEVQYFHDIIKELNCPRTKLGANPEYIGFERSADELVYF